jgi:hypothetical protein
MSKELWLDEMERILSEKLEAGVDFDLAYERAGNEAHGALTDRLADMADDIRKRRKEG